jgi:hypothetical protein
MTRSEAELKEFHDENRWSSERLNGMLSIQILQDRLILLSSDWPARLSPKRASRKRQVHYNLYLLPSNSNASGSKGARSFMMIIQSCSKTKNRQDTMRVESKY